MKAVIPSPRSWFLGPTPVDPYVLSVSAKPCSFNPNSYANSKSVLVQVHAASINPVDYKLPTFIAGKSFPGLDFCGTILQVGSNVTEVALGDLVYGTSTSGSLAEITTAPMSRIAKALTIDRDTNHKPWSVFEYAALPVAYQSALQSLRRGQIYIPDSMSTDVSNINCDKSLLVIGASGGCGIAGIQLAKALKVSRIVAVCSGKNAGLVREQGATEVVDYTQSQQMESFFKDNQGTFDCVYDAASNSGGQEDYWSISQSLLKPDGVFVALNGSGGKWIKQLTGFSNPKSSILLCDSNSKDLQLVVKLLDSADIRPVVEILPFTEDGVKKAFATLRSRRTRGKIVLDVLSK